MIDPELFELIPKIDLSTPEKVVAFKMWQLNDGTVEGLRKLYEAQQSVQRTCLQCGSQSFNDYQGYLKCNVCDTIANR